MGVRWLLVAVCFLLAFSCARASAPFGKVPDMPPLSQAIAALPAGAKPTSGLVLIINSENRRPPKSDIQTEEASAAPVPPYATQSLYGIAALYDLTEQTFGRVTALGPATMRLMNPNPAPLPFTLGGMSRSDALQILVGSLTDSQLQKLGSPAGIGLTDLDEVQEPLFTAVFAQLLQVAPESANFPTLRDKYLAENPSDPDAASEKAQAEVQAQIRTVSLPSLAGVRITCQLDANYSLKTPSLGYHSIFVPLHGLDPRPGVDYYERETDPPPTDPIAAYFVQDLPNTLKPGDLNWNARALGALVSVDGAKTAGDIVQRAAKATGLELYCDPRYAHESATFLGDVSRPVPAADLLRALCVCVTGTFRAVGPAFVLTDDLPGMVGTRERNRAVANGVGDEARSLTTAADHRFEKDSWLSDLSFAPDDPDALPQGMIGKYLPTAAIGDDEDLKIPLGELPASIQQGLRDYVAGKPTPDYLPADAYQQVSDAMSPAFPVHVYLGTDFLADIPGLGKVALQDYASFINLRDEQATAAPKAPVPAGTKVTVAAETRGALCAPKTAGEARKIVDKLAAIGMNTLYCDVFTQGQAYVPNSAIPPADPDAATVLSTAVDEGRAKGVRVVAVLDTLCWRRGADIDLTHAPLPEGCAQDLAATGETSLQVARRFAIDGDRIPGDDPTTPPPPVQEEVWMDPGDPAVQTDLRAIVSAVAAMPHLAGIEFRDTAGPGYEEDFTGAMALPLGFTPQARLAFLRQYSADPIDLETADAVELAFVGSLFYGGNLIYLNLPEFDDGEWDLSESLAKDWSKMREGIDLDLMATLWKTAKDASTNLPIFVQDRRYGDIVAPWTDPKQPSDVAPLTEGANYYTSRIPDELSGGAALIVDYSDFRTNPSHWYGATDPSNRTPSNATAQDDSDALTASHGRGGIIFDLVDDPSPDGPLRDLTLIGEHVTFVPTGR